jgi:hypothetical protein
VHYLQTVEVGRCKVPDIKRLQLFFFRGGPDASASAPAVNTHSYQSKIRGTKYVSYDAQLCPLIDKGQRAPNAQVTCQIVNRHSEELKFSSPDSQTLKNPV